jgi:Group II intron, maturase-specific domain
MNYYSHFYKSALYQLYEHIDNKLMRWARRKYRGVAPIKPDTPRAENCQ